jgi:hypothetical protein
MDKALPYPIAHAFKYMIVFSSMGGTPYPGHAEETNKYNSGN